IACKVMDFIMTSSCACAMVLCSQLSSYPRTHTSCGCLHMTCTRPINNPTWN
ncbi:hypothetical protein STEG23_022790, partial [Scotinomys teguina]